MAVRERLHTGHPGRRLNNPLAARELRLRPLTGLPEIEEGTDLGGLIAAAAAPSAGEIVVVSQKIVSKTEGRVRLLSEISPGEEALRLAAQTGKDPRLVELILGESRSVLRAVPNLLLTETNAGWICANAGLDLSNVPGEDTVALLPEDADASARRIRAEIRGGDGGGGPAVIVADSFGRAWRLGQTDIAIGCAGIDPLADWRGRPDAAGRRLEATEIAVADQLAASADLVRDKDSAVPGAVISGLEALVTEADGPGAVAIQRPAAEDLFR
ncbi:MAG: coenzyme F420-0:L-glutamate ligase [Solirubrobacterales bacterium]